MRAHLHRIVFVVLLVMLAAPAMAQQGATPQAAPQPTPQAAPQPARQPTPQAAPQPPRPATPVPAAAPVAPAPPIARLPIIAPLLAEPQAVPTPTTVMTLQTPGTSPAPSPYASTLRPPTASVNFRVEVQVTDRLDAKILGQESFTAFTSGAKTKISRTTPTTTAALEVTVSTLPGNPPPDAVFLRLGAQFRLAKGLAGEKDSGVDLGQEVSTNVGFGKPVTVIDMSSGAEGKRRFVVQVTVTRVPLE